LGGFGLECFGSNPLVRPLGHINPGAIAGCAGPGGSVPVGMGQFETGKVQACGFQHFSSIYWAVCGI